MKLHTTLIFLAVLGLSPLFAQEEIMITSEPIAIPERAQDPNEPLAIAEVMPSFPGGQEAMYAYIGREMKYPDLAVDNGIQGVVFVTFVVERDGSISNAKVLRGIGGGCDQEAVRVVQGMPTWTPGTQDGKPVRVQFNLPFRFKLQEPKGPKK
ncbi:MAG: energy transducer TonB [Flavobacteriales bacterium]